MAKKNETVLDKIRPKAPKFLMGWTPKQFSSMERAIVRHFEGKKIEMRWNNGSNWYEFHTFDGINEILGLAYTSSSSYAAYWVCNGNAYNEKFPQHRYIGFAIGEDGKYYAVLRDKDQNDITIKM